MQRVAPEWPRPGLSGLGRRMRLLGRGWVGDVCVLTLGWSLIGLSRADPRPHLSPVPVLAEMLPPVGAFVPS